MWNCFIAPGDEAAGQQSYLLWHYLILQLNLRSKESSLRIFNRDPFILDKQKGKYI
jgi:hypothetical protein